MRLGASRLGYCFPNVVIRINGVERQTKVLVNSLSIVDAINEQPNTARFQCLSGFTPAVGQEVIIGLGDWMNRLFGGQIIRLGYLQQHVDDPVRYDVECLDWTRSFDRRRVTQFFPSQSASLIAASIVSTFTAGFTGLSIAGDLPVVENFPCTMETPSNALTRLANLIDGSWYIDDHKDVHLFGAAGELGPRAPTSPLPLTNTLTTLRRFSFERDLSQVRTRVFVETRGTRTVAPVSAGLTVLPVEDVGVLDTLSQLVLIPDIGLFTWAEIYSSGPDLGNALKTTTVTTAAAIGATSLDLANVIGFRSLGAGVGWVRVGSDLYVRYSSQSFVSFPSPPGTLLGIPAAGFGAITRAITVGEIVSAVSLIDLGVGLPALMPEGSSLYSVSRRPNTDPSAEQTALAAIEGGDGIHDHYIQDRRLTVLSGRSVGDAELDAWASPILNATCLSKDANMRSGRMLPIALTGQTNLSTTLQVQQVEIRGFDKPSILSEWTSAVHPEIWWPDRYVTLAPRRPATMRDLLRRPTEIGTDR